MLLAKIRGEPFASEIPAPQFHHIKPASALRDLSSAVIALVTDGGIVPEVTRAHGAGRPTRFTTIPSGIDRLDPKQLTSFIPATTPRSPIRPHRLVPLDVCVIWNSKGHR
jgi:glycine reductase